MKLSRKSVRVCLSSIYLPLRNFLIRIGFLRLRTKYRLLAWKIERVFFNTLCRKKKVCIFTRHASNSGLLAVFRYFLGGIAYADRRGLLPVIDMKNTPNAYLFDDEVGHVNAWEYYFLQPSGIPLEEAERSGDAVALEVDKFPVPRQDISTFLNKNGELDYWRDICRKYIHFSRPVVEALGREQAKFAGKKVLGVSLRGTDYIMLKIHDHPVQPTPEQVIAKASEVMASQNYDALYLSTEDKNIAEEFKNVFGDKLLLPEGEYIDYKPSADKWITMYSTHRDNDKYLMGLEYLVSKLALTKCDGLITSMTNGTVIVMCLSEGFDYLHVFDLGLYP